MKLPALIAFSHVDFTGYPHTACIHLIACSVEGKSYTLLACSNACLAFFDGVVVAIGLAFVLMVFDTVHVHHVYQLIVVSPLHLIRTSSSLNTDTPSLLKIDTVLSSANFPTLINDDGHVLKESAVVAVVDNCGNGSVVLYLPCTTSPFATPTLFLDCFSIGKCNCFLSFSDM